MKKSQYTPPFGIPVKPLARLAASRSALNYGFFGNNLNVSPDDSASGEEPNLARAKAGSLEFHGLACSALRNGRRPYGRAFAALITALVRISNLLQ
jgi:hypothetical protein